MFDGENKMQTENSNNNENIFPVKEVLSTGYLKKLITNAKIIANSYQKILYPAKHNRSYIFCFTPTPPDRVSTENQVSDSEKAVGR